MKYLFTKKELKEIIDTANSPFKINGAWVCLAFHNKTRNSPAFYTVQYGKSDTMFCPNMTEVINYLHRKVNNEG